MRDSPAVVPAPRFPEDVELSWLDPRCPDGRDLAGATALLEAARVVDCPHEPVPTVTSLVAHLRHGYDGDLPLIALAHGAAGRVDGILEVCLPHRDNRHLGCVRVTVDPLNRRTGLGRHLFAAGVERVRAERRGLILADCYDGTAGMPFLKAMGMDRASEQVQRRQDLRDADWATLDRAYEAAQPYAVDYEFLRMTGATRDDMVADLARIAVAINDAPTDDLDVEDLAFSPGRIRAFERAQAAHDRRLYRLIARQRHSGELAGHTAVGVDAQRPGFGWQYKTSVPRAHRGHRLGLVLKVGMLRWLAEVEPQLRTLDTWNAATNVHMIRVNQVLNYRVVGSLIGWQRHI